MFKKLILQLILGIALGVVYLSPLFANSTISDYERIFIPVYSQSNTLLIALRVFKMNNVPSFLVVDPNTLETSVKPISTVKTRKFVKENTPGYVNHWEILSSYYYQLLQKSTAAPYHLENQGLIHANLRNRASGNILTIDLCPSVKPFEKAFFNKLVDLSNTQHRPIPITIAISGLWLQTHGEEFQWLQAQERDNKLRITWANHSFSHVYYADLPYSQNFLLRDETNRDAEIVLTEKYLLEHDATPSVFYRFPGLVSDKAWIKKMRLYGLIPLGTDAWMATLPEKNQKITNGGIILVHGNGNEHQGIVLLEQILPQLQLLDIRSSS